MKKQKTNRAKKPPESNAASQLHDLHNGAQRDELDECFENIRAQVVILETSDDPFDRIDALWWRKALKKAAAGDIGLKGAPEYRRGVRPSDPTDEWIGPRSIGEWAKSFGFSEAKFWRYRNEAKIRCRTEGHDAWVHSDDVAKYTPPPK